MSDTGPAGSSPSDFEPQGVPAGGSSLSVDDAPTGNDGTAGVDSSAGDASAPEADSVTGIPDARDGEKPSIDE